MSHVFTIQYMSSLCSAVDYNSKGLFKCICNQVNYLGRKIKAKVTLTLLGRISNFLYWRFPYPCHRRSFETHDNSLLKKIILIVSTKKLKGEIRLNKRIKNKMGEQTKLSQIREILKLWGGGRCNREQCTHSSIESRLHIYIYF